MACCAREIHFLVFEVEQQALNILEGSSNSVDTHVRGLKAASARLKKSKNCCIQGNVCTQKKHAWSSNSNNATNT